MEFSFECPKCQGADFNITRDRRTFAPTRAYELIFSCRCGKQLFGEQIEKEYDRQYKLFQVAAGRSGDVMMDPDMRVDQDRREALRRAMLYQRQHREEQRRRNLAEESGRSTNRDGWSVTSAESVVANSDEWLPNDHPERCTWHQCNKRHRPNSKYCSRNCSNKNARHRHKARRHGGSEEEAA
jgi:hypothetical protein